MHAQTGSESNNVIKDSSQPTRVVEPDEPGLSQVQYVTTSVTQRGNRNKALLLRERRELLKERRTRGYARCNKVNSREVDNKWVQDRTKRMVIIGSDAVSLYPSMTKRESADEVANAVLESNIKWEGVNWKEATRFLVLGRDETWCRGSKLWRVLPRRKYNHGCKPGLTGAGPMGANPDDENQWQFKRDMNLTELERKIIMAEVLRLAVEIMFDTHIYSFGGHFYKQKEGGPIGLRSTCALARVVMGRWDIKWKERVADCNIQVEDDGRFVDDARNFLYPLRPGWRWEQGELWFSREWEQEDQLLSPIERTKRAVFGSMQGIIQCLSFTVETEEDFQDGWLPTLDFKLRVNNNNVIEYAFYEKPMASNQCLQTDTALNQNCLIRSLGNEVIRRLDAFNETVGIEMKVEALDIFCQKMINSGHSISTVRSVLVSGVKGYDRRVARCKASGIPLHRSAAQSSGARRTKKLLAKTQWFRQESGETEQDGQQARPGAWGGEEQSSKKQRGVPRRVAEQAKQPRITTVLFVEFTRGGELQKKMRETLDRLTPMLGFRARVAEKGGTNLESLLSNKNLWKGRECGRHSCRTCAQSGEQKEPCTLRNVVYESECGKCNKPGERKEQDKESLEDKRAVASIYVGETARSISERAQEHWRDGESMKEESHMTEHQQQSHVGEQPDFNFRVVKKCQSSLERQVREAVRIMMRGNVLNKKGTYNRCKLTRLVVDEEWESRVWQEAWEQEAVADVDEECLAPKGKGKKRNDSSSTSSKKIRLEEEVEWGTGSQETEESRHRFLYDPTPQTTQGAAGGLKQAILKPMRGVEWVMSRMVIEVASMAVSLAELTKGADTWAEWVDEEEQVSKRSKKEEQWLWKRLEESDREQAKAEKISKWKKTAKVEKARKKMGASSSQPSIREGWTKRAGLKQSHTPAHPISQPQESSEAFARIGLVTNKVSPKKLKTSEPQQPRPAVEPLLGLVRGVRGDPRVREEELSSKKSVMEGGGCVNTQTGSMSNIVRPDVSLVEKTGAKPQPQPVQRAVPQPLQAAVGGLSSKKPVGEGGGCVYTQTGSLSNIVTSTNLQVTDEGLPTPRSEESTLGSSKDPVNVNCPGWKSSQVVQGSGVFDPEGVKSLETCPGANRKAMMEGEECVNTQTGSLSNIVQPDVSLVERPGAVPQPQPVQRAVPQPLQATEGEVPSTKSMREGGGCVNTQTGYHSNTVLHGAKSVTGSSAVYTSHNVHTGVGTVPGESTLGSSEDPVNVDCPGWKSSQAVQGSGVFGLGGVKSPEKHAVQTKVSHASQQQDSEMSSVRNVSASGSKSSNMRSVTHDKCASEECDVLVDGDVRNDGVQASLRSKLKVSKISKFRAKSSSFNTIKTGGNNVNKGDMKAASKVASFGKISKYFENFEISKMGRGVTVDNSRNNSNSITSSPKHSYKSDKVSTPIKRRLRQQNNTSRLISNFESRSISDPHWSEGAGSPAKRRKYLI